MNDSDIRSCCGSHLYQPHEPYCHESPHHDLWQFGFITDGTTVSCRGCGSVVVALQLHESVCTPLKYMKSQDLKAPWVKNG